MKSLKIVYFIDSRSGFAVKWCNSFIELGHQVYLISFFQKPELLNEKVNFIQIFSKFKGHRFKFFTNYFRIKEIIKKIKPDIVHAIQVTRQGLMASFIDYHPLIVTAIGSDVFIEPKKNIINNRIVNYCFKKSDLVTSMAEHMTEYIKSNFTINKEKLITFPWGCDNSLFNNTNIKKQENPILILCNRGMNSKIYNQELIINAIPLVIEKYKNIRFIFLSDGIYRKEYETLVKKLEVKKYVEFIGRVSPKEMSEWMKKSMVFISPSKSDGNNISLNEAMACECFPIATDIPANRQWIEDNKNGFLVPIDDYKYLAKKIIDFFSKKNYNNDFKFINSQIVMYKGNWQKQIKKIEKVYNDLKEKYNNEN